MISVFQNIQKDKRKEKWRKMGKFKNVIWIVALIILIVLIGIIGYGYYRNATMEVTRPIATMEVENFGTIKFELYPE